MQSESDFSKWLGRVLRRDAIGKNFDAQGGGKAIETRNIRAIEEQDQRHEVNQGLVEQLNVVEPNTDRLLNSLIWELREKLNRQDLTIVLLGSAAVGGKTIKNILVGEKVGDNELDYALLTDTLVSSADATTIHAQFEALLVPTARELNLLRPDSYRACGTHNAIYERYVNAHDPQVLAEEINQAIDENRKLVEDGLLDFSEILDEISRYLIIYFQPSYPAEVNQNNIQVVLDALSLINQANPNNFQIIKQDLLREWQKNHRLKEKHLTGKKAWTDDRTAKFVKNVGESSSQAMSQPLENLLDQV